MREKILQSEPVGDSEGGGWSRSKEKNATQKE